MIDIQNIRAAHQSLENLAISQPYLAHTFYHVFSRGIGGQRIFREPTDNIVFLALLKQYIRMQKLMDALEKPPREYVGAMRLHVYALLPTHFQLLLQQSDDPDAMKRLMHAVSASYNSYFNKKYKHVGPLFIDVFKATKVENDHSLLSLAHHLHRSTPPNAHWYESSLPVYLGHEEADWISTYSLRTLLKPGQSYHMSLQQA